MTSLSLCHCVALTDISVIQLVTSSSPYLKRIDLTECRLITNLTVQVIAQLCSQLEDLSLQGCGLVTDDVIEELAYHCTRLQSVNLGQCVRVSDRALIALLRNSGRMTHLNSTSKTRTRNARLTKLGVAGCSGITLSGLLMISDHLTSSKMRDANPSSLISLEFTCPVLKKASNNNQNGNTQPARATITLSPASRLFQTLPRTLEEITIHDSFVLSHDDVICLVDRVGPNLRTLRLDNANAVKSETMTHILSVCSNLAVLCLPRAIQLDDTGVVQLTTAKCAPSLVELDLSACHALTDSSLTKLATARPLISHSNATSPNAIEISKGKGVKERAMEPYYLFPNLRRLDLSYNDKLTLTGIIPLVMSLKSLCALDVSFCGKGVTRSWNSSLESIRPVLNSTGASVPSQNSVERDGDFQDGDSSESSSSEDEEGSYSPSTAPQQCQHGQSFRTSNLISGTQQSPAHQNMQQAGPINTPSRHGVGRYVGPLLNRSAATSQNNTIVPQHPQQYPEQGARLDDEVQQHNRRRSSASSMSSTTSSASSASSSSSSTSLSSTGTTTCSAYPTSTLDPCPYVADSFSTKPDPQHQNFSGQQKQQQYQRRRRRSPSRIILADRLDILDNTPRRVGIPASFHLESWFTPQHQIQLQHLLQIQLQNQREQQDQQAAAVLPGTGVPQGQLSSATSVAYLLPEMMTHPVMRAARAGAATIGVGGLPQNRQNQQHHPALALDVQELHENLNTQLRLEPVVRSTSSPRVGAGGARNGTSRRYHRQHHHHHQNHHLRRGSAGSGGMIGHCEISAWGLSKLKAEWSKT
ncbi:hypothetical protein BGX27_007696 [Mortierella sp. AM989]|nr:hypothetical protein BGX27_007696 [Mortierella sp. AM989]